MNDRPLSLHQQLDWRKPLCLCNCRVERWTGLGTEARSAKVAPKRDHHTDLSASRHWLNRICRESGGPFRMGDCEGVKGCEGGRAQAPGLRAVLVSGIRPQALPSPGA